ncbi:MAG: lipase family alpha/beta hydrolase [Steroidobacterales bacterium]
MIATDSALDHVTPYDRFAWSDTMVGEWLASGAHAVELIAYFGATEYRDLAALARRAQRTPVADPALAVLIVPGIMGSQLGIRRPVPLPDDIVWIDPIDIQHGRLRSLRLPGPARIVPLGAVLFSYLRLKLQLRASGLAAEFFDYDWRLSAAEAGRGLAERLRNHPAARLHVVAHSLGGLVARAALAHPGTEKVTRVILLGTPNHGSYAAVQALRGTDAVVRKVARLAPDSAEMLATEVYSSFPSLYDLLPPGDARTALWDPTAWPRTGPQPRAALLAGARTDRERLAPPDARFICVAGIGQPTVTAVARRGDDFLYTLTRAGDGTVPAASAALSGTRSYFARVAHSDLTRDREVGAAVVDLLRHGATKRLPGNWRGTTRACAQVSDAQLRRLHAVKVNWGTLSPEERRAFLQNLNEPVSLKLRMP